ncbi:MAG: phage major capsid protein [Actinomycetota bacterium]
MATYTERAKAKIEERATVWSRAEKILDRAETDDGRDLTPEERTEFDKIEGQLRDLDADVKRYESAAERDHQHTTLREAPFEVRNADGERTEETDTSEAYRAAFDGYLRGGLARLDDDARALVERNFAGKGGDTTRAQATLPDTAGGYLVPPEYSATLIQTMKAFGGMLEVGFDLVTASAEELPWPTFDGTARKATILGQGKAPSKGTLTFGQRRLYAHIYRPETLLVSFQLLRDSAVDLEDMISTQMGEEIGRGYNEHATTGSGASEPQGFLTGVASGKQTAGGQTTSIIYADLVDLEHSVDPAYRNERSRFMFNDLTLASLRKLVDADGRPLWEPSLQVGQPNLINGSPYTVNQDMPDLAASATPMAYGDFERGYVNRRVQAFRIIRLEEKYAEELQVGFVGYQEMDGGVRDASAIRKLTMAAA